MTATLLLLAQTAATPVVADDGHATIAGLYAALTALIILITTISQTAWQQYQAARLAKEQKEALEAVAAKQKSTTDAAEKAALEAATVARVNTQKLDSVLNGEGIGGTLEQLAKGQIDQAAWQARHDEKDDERFGELTASVLIIRDLLRQKNIEQRTPPANPSSHA